MPVGHRVENFFAYEAVCCVAARAFNIVLWERLKDFARFEMERLPKDKNIDVSSRFIQPIQGRAQDFP